VSGDAEGRAVELLVLGAGPAGIGAAVEASRCGVETVILDEQPVAGGQVYRALSDSLKVSDAAALGEDYATGTGLRAELAESNVEGAFGEKVWFAAPGFRIESVGSGGVRRWQSKALISATGTSERVIPVPGWTTPGVIGLAAATVLLKAQQMVPGETTVVAGCGPLVTAVTASILKGGGRVAAMVDVASRSEWLGALPALLRRPDLLQRGMRWQRLIRQAGVPVLHRHAVTEVRGDGGVSEVVVRPVDGDWRPHGAERVFQADAVALGHGLVPGTEVTRLLRAEHEFVDDRGGWIAKQDGDFRTTVEGLYVAGDGCGISGGAAAEIEGRIAGLTAALDLGKLEKTAYATKTAPLRRSMAQAESVGVRMSHMMTPRPGILDTITPDTVVCRCEDVTRGEIEETLEAGAFEVNQLKSWTRCGMGPCQGRMCGDVTARLVADRVGGREKAGSWTARVPIRPVALDDLAGEFEYEDIWESSPEPTPS
jgi:thioredoxin reductase/bacterioferritin-associated ferredoxin